MADYYTKAEYDNARNGDILSCLCLMGYEFEKQGSYYKNKQHDSLVVNPNNGQYHWNSKDIHGNQPIELLKQILINDCHYDGKTAYITAIKRLAGTEGQNLKNGFSFPLNSRAAKEKTDRNLNRGNITLPQKNKSVQRVIHYLCEIRGLDKEIIQDLISTGKIFETQYGHPCFVSSDKYGIPCHAFIRGQFTNKDGECIQYKKDIKNSDKSNPFVIRGNEKSNRLYCFEASIDAISHASLYKINNLDYKDGYRIGLHCTSFLGLDTFLKENPQIDEIVACLDNDEAGRRRAEKMCIEYKDKGYSTFLQLPNEKDFNEQLIKYKNAKCENELKNENDFELE